MGTDIPAGVILFIAFLTWMANNYDTDRLIYRKCICSGEKPVGVERITVKLVLVLMGLLQLGDGVMTQVFTGNGIAKEGNPMMMSMVSGGNFLVFKIVGLVVCIAALWVTYKYVPRLSKVMASLIAVFYAGVIAWNMSVVFGQV